MSKWPPVISRVVIRVADYTTRSRYITLLFKFTFNLLFQLVSSQINATGFNKSVEGGLSINQIIIFVISFFLKNIIIFVI